MSFLFLNLKFVFKLNVINRSLLNRGVLNRVVLNSEP